MKKIIVVLLSLILFACSSKQSESISIAVPSGAPSLAFYDELDNNSFNTGDAQSILPELLSDNGSDIIVIDTVNGIKALNKGADYKLAATITFGNFYIASTGNDENDVMEDGDYIVVFSQGATPDLVFHYIYGEKLDSNLHYVQAVSDASACLIKGINIADNQNKVDYVMIAEPALSAALSQNNNASVYGNIQDEYANKTDGLSMIQASVFVSNRLSKDVTNQYLSDLENTINDMLSNPQIFEEATSTLEDAEIKDIFGIPNSKIATKVLSNNSIGLGYKKAYDNKQAIDQFISLFDMETTNEEIYIK